MYTKNNANQPMPNPAYMPAPTPYMQNPQYSTQTQVPSMPESEMGYDANGFNNPYIPPMMPSGEFGMEKEMDTFNNPLCMRAMIERYIGKIVRAQFLIGGVLHDHVGRLMSVGTSYMVIEALKEHVITICDLYSVKFVTVMFDENDM